jgi:hypothetical protein
MTQKFFTSYSGIKLPLKLVGEIDPAEIKNRNTFIRAEFDSSDRLISMEHIVYSEPQLRHDYTYREDGTLAKAEINNLAEEEINVLTFDETGAPVSV